MINRDSCKILLLLFLSSFLVAPSISGSSQNYYDVLNVDRDATRKEIKAAFRNLAIKYHPDKNSSPDAEEKFREIAEAYEVLSNDERRKQYDQFGDDGLNTKPHNDDDYHYQRGGGNTYSFHTNFQKHFDMNDFFKRFDDMFNQNDNDDDDQFGGSFGFMNGIFENIGRMKSRFSGGFGGRKMGTGFRSSFSNSLNRFGKKSSRGNFRSTSSGFSKSCRTVTTIVNGAMMTKTTCTSSNDEL